MSLPQFSARINGQKTCFGYAVSKYGRAMDYLLFEGRQAGDILTPAGIISFLQSSASFEKRGLIAIDQRWWFQFHITFFVQSVYHVFA